MIKIENKESCSGCSACKSICPVECIEMIPDKEGFLYPKVDEEKCIHCNKCDHVCPVKNRIIPCESLLETYAVQSKDKERLLKCTSGGAFTEIAIHLLNMGWYISGVVFDEEFCVKHIVSNKLEDVNRFSGSKYVQSEMNNVFETIIQLLKNGKKILFCGTPCQVEGLKRCVGNLDENLLTIDLVCHGVPSPEIWRQYIQYATEKRGEIEYVNFRSKRFGYHVTVMEECYEKGKKYYGSARSHIMSKVFFSNIADRPICYKCPFKTQKRVSDLTIYDCWNLSKLTELVTDNDKGYTNVVVHTKKGEKAILDMTPYVDMYKVETGKAIDADGKMMLNSVPENMKREAFYEALNNYGLISAVNQFLPITLKDRAIDKGKNVLNKTGLLKYIKAFKGRIKCE